jgi:hypothetical protein
MTYETISLIADISLALSFLVALVFGFIQVKQIARDRRERFTLETLRTFQTREFAEVEGKLSYHKPHLLLRSLNSFRCINRHSLSSFHRKWNPWVF